MDNYSKLDDVVAAQTKMPEIPFQRNRRVGEMSMIDCAAISLVARETWQDINDLWEQVLVCSFSSFDAMDGRCRSTPFQRVNVFMGED